MGVEEMRRLLKRHYNGEIRLSEEVRYSDWLLDILSDCGRDFDCLLNKAETFQDLLVIHGFIQAMEGYSECKEDYGIDEELEDTGKSYV